MLGGSWWQRKYLKIQIHNDNNPNEIKSKSFIVCLLLVFSILKYKYMKTILQIQLQPRFSRVAAPEKSHRYQLLHNSFINEFDFCLLLAGSFLWAGCNQFHIMESNHPALQFV